MESAMGEDLSNEDECPVWTASVRALSTAQGVPPNAGWAATASWSVARTTGDYEALRGGLVLQFGCPDRRGGDPKS